MTWRILMQCLKKDFILCSWFKLCWEVISLHYTTLFKVITVVMKASCREQALCQTHTALLATICLFCGDEVSRQQFRKSVIVLFELSFVSNQPQEFVSLIGCLMNVDLSQVTTHQAWCRQKSAVWKQLTKEHLLWWAFPWWGIGSGR